MLLMHLHNRIANHSVIYYYTPEIIIHPNDTRNSTALKARVEHGGFSASLHGSMSCWNSDAY